MRLAICDDDPAALDQLRALIVDYRQQKVEKYVETVEFKDVAIMLEAVQKQPYDAVILDILMPKLNGIQLGKFIRKHSPQTVIIYLSASPEFAMDAYEIHAARYMVKPPNKEQLFEALDFAMSQSQKVVPSFSIKTQGGGIAMIRHDQILYVELSSRKMIVHMIDGSEVTSIYLRDTFTEACDELIQTGNFVFTHKSYLVNMEYIREYNSSFLTLIDGLTVPVSRQHSMGVKKNYLAYCAKGV